MQHQPANFIRHVGQESTAVFLGKLACVDNCTDQNLDVHLVIGTIHTGRIIDRIGIDASPGQCVLDAAQLREAKIAAFCHDIATQFITVDAQRIGGAITHFEVRLIARLYIGANAAVIE